MKFAKNVSFDELMTPYENWCVGKNRSLGQILGQSFVSMVLDHIPFAIIYRVSLKIITLKSSGPHSVRVYVHKKITILPDNNC